MTQFTLFEELLSQRIPSPPSLPVTFMEVAQMPHYEVVISRIYQFYLQDLEEHGFKDLFLGALFSLVNQKWKTHANTERIFFSEQPARWDVETEVSTKNGKRIDLLISWERDNQKHYIIIENKIFHILLNDLEDYFNTPEGSPENKIGVLLTLEQQFSRHQNFINITHDELMREVKKRLGEYIMTGVDRHLFFIRDFILNLSKLTKNAEYMNEFSKFYFEHRSAIEKLVKARNAFLQQVFKAYETTGQILNMEVGGKRADNYQYIIKERGQIMFTLVFNDYQSAPFSIVYEVQGKKLQFKEALREHARKLISPDKWPTVWVSDWGNASCAHIVGVSYERLNEEQQDLSAFFEKEMREIWLPIAEELSTIFKENV